jgi:hypothetical protein
VVDDIRGLAPIEAYEPEERCGLAEGIGSTWTERKWDPAKAHFFEVTRVRAWRRHQHRLVALSADRTNKRETKVVQIPLSVREKQISHVQEIVFLPSSDPVI